MGTGPPLGQETQRLGHDPVELRHEVIDLAGGQGVAQLDPVRSPPLDHGEVADTDLKDPTRREANRQGAHRAGAAVVDPKPWLCPRSGGCPVVVGDTFVYRDESHLAESYAEALAPVLRQELRKQGMTGD